MSRTTGTAPAAAILALLSAALLALALAAQAAIIRVPGDVPTIQAGLDSAAAGDTVLVDHGTYHENLVWPNTQGIDLLANEQAPPESTIIDGSLAEATVIEMLTPCDNTTVIRGFVIARGDAANGGGAYVECSPVFVDDNFLDNAADSSGGGICIRPPLVGLPPARIVSCSFNACAAHRGGGIAVIGPAEAVIRDCRFDACTASHGSGVHAASNATVRGCAFTCDGTVVAFDGSARADSNEVSATTGVGFQCTGACTLSCNQIHASGTGVDLSGGSAAYVALNHLDGNTTGIRITDAAPSIEYNRITGGNVGIECCSGDGTRLTGNFISHNNIGFYT